VASRTLKYSSAGFLGFFADLGMRLLRVQGMRACLDRSTNLPELAKNALLAEIEYDEENRWMFRPNPIT